MKLKIISAIVAAAFGGFTGNSFALPVAAYQSTAGDTAELFVSGATAQENGLRLTVSRMCTPGSLDVYRFTNQEAQFCTINKTIVTGLPASVTKMVVYKSGVGGSGNGVQPVANATTLQFISMAALKANTTLIMASTAVAAVAPTAPDTIGVPGYNNVAVSPTAIQTLAPDAGFSDVEPALLGASAVELTRLQVAAPNVLIFGVPVTRAARNALQTAQNLPSGSDTEADMPSLGRNLINSVYTGNVTNWSQLGVTLADDTIYLATRVETSGTQKTFNTLITGSACTASLQPVLAGTGVAADCTAASPGQTIVAGSGSGNVLTCMAGHNNNSRGAFGVLSMEFRDITPANPAALPLPLPAVDNGFRWIKIDGFSPSHVNVVNGNYSFWVEPSFQYRKAPAPVPLTGNKKIIADRIVLQLGTEAVLSQLNNALTQTWGRSGLLAKPSAANPPNVIVPPTTAAAVLANPTNAFTRSPSGSPLNCQPPVLFN